MEETTSIHIKDENALRQQARLTHWTWDGANVLELTDTVAGLFQRIPVFTRHPLRSGDEENRLKDEIRREPLSITEASLPVATVSKVYSLIQHRDVLSSVTRALKLLDFDVSAVESTVLLSEYGERMQWSCDIPNIDFDPGDQNPIVLRINCLNSVDESTAFEISFSWFRLVCGNGMMFGIRESRLKRRHTQSLDPKVIADYLEDQLGHVDEEASLHQCWYNTAVDRSTLVSWVDEDVANEWGPHAAARVWHIMTRGRDGEVQQAADCEPHELRLLDSSERVVPGCHAPVTNVFHVSQALSWIAGTRKTVPERLRYVKAIPQLVEPFTEANQRSLFRQTRN
jgi:hypothetical protein